MDVGEKIGKYEIRGTLGRGAMGVVYDAFDPLIQRRVAIKTVRLLREDEDPEAAEGLARFRREAQAAGRLQHPNIVGVYDYGETGEFAYLVMEFVDGRSVKAALDAQERFPIPEIARVMHQLLDALQYSHEHGVVHRDIKPANMMLTRDGRVKVADFGVARIESSNMTQVGTVIGTPAYMSPEQLAGQTVDSRSDIYSAGVVLYQLLTGDRPYHGSNLTSIYHQALNAEPVPPSKLAVTVPPAFDPVVARAMAKRPAERYANAAEFAIAVDAAANQGAAVFAPDDEPDATVVTRSVKPEAARHAASAMPTAAAANRSAPAARTGNRAVAFGAVAAAVLVVAGGGAWYLTRPAAPVGDGSEPAPQTASSPTKPPASPTAPANQASASATIPGTPPASTTAQASQPAVRPSAEPAKPPQSIGTQPVAPPPSTAPTKPPVIAAPANVAPASSGPGSATGNQIPATTPTPSPVTPPSPATASQPPITVAMTAGALRSAIAAALAPVGCTFVGGNVRGSDVSLIGVAGAGAATADLHRAVAEAAPTAAVDWRIATFDGPYCRALDVIRPVAAGFGSTGSGFAMGLRSGSKPLLEGQLMTIDFTMPNYPAWLLVDYLQHDGTVWHMHPNAKDPARQYTAGAHVSLGDPAAGGERWEVGAPYGTDMIIAVASSEPLFTQKRKELEPADGYLAALRTAIEAAERRNEHLASDALVLTTEPKH
jgi:serine/threonine protein kinase